MKITTGSSIRAPGEDAPGQCMTRGTRSPRAIASMFGVSRTRKLPDRAQPERKRMFEQVLGGAQVVVGEQI